MPTHDELRLLSNRLSNDVASPQTSACGTQQTFPNQQNHPLTQNTIAISPVSSQYPKKQPLNLLQHEQNQRKSLNLLQHCSPFQKTTTPNLNHSDSNDSSTTNNDDSSTNSSIHHCQKIRPRSRSLSSPSRSPIIDNEISTMNQLYKERFPKATKQMEERLTNLINDHKNTSVGSNRDSQPIVRFVTNQVMEIARDCLHKSHAKLITGRYFYEMTENLQRLLVETSAKSAEAAGEIARIVKKLILIISRPARLLECLEFDPEEFYQLLEAAEDQAKTHITADLPQYIITKLGLNREPEEFSDKLCDNYQYNYNLSYDNKQR